MGEASYTNTTTVDDDLLLKNFFAELGEVERDNEVTRILSCFKLNAFEYLNLPFHSSPEDIIRQYRKLSLMVHPDKCKHPQAKEAFGALAKAQQLSLDPQEREYFLNQVNSTKGEMLSSNGNNEDYWRIIHIPDKPKIPHGLQPTVNTYASIIDPKHANTIVRKLNHIAPLENLRHVKRVRKKCVEGKIQLSVILCLACNNISQLDNMRSDMLELIKSYQLSTFITKVCKYAASSKEEWEEQCKLWPTSYHPPTYNINGITGFSEEDSQSVFRFMKFAVDLAKSVDGQVVNAAVIVDPSSNQVIASSCDQGFSWNNHETKTSMEARSLEQCEVRTAHLVTNGVQNHRPSSSNCSSDELKRIYDDVSCLHPWRWAEQQFHTSDCFWHPFRHAAIVAIEYSAARDRRLFPASEHIGDKYTQADYMDSPSTGSPSKRQKTNLVNVEETGKQNSESNGCHSAVDRPYLCTGYDIYLVWEPCIMCAMALVHQRIKRIFYAFPNPNSGALGSVHRLQGEKSLNHHYAVFRVLLPEEVLGEGEIIIATTKSD